ncbi:MCE family protein [Nonomuraea jiangxiensis]|uniref:Phospholipid/cholesterol/gamma-HCH transport system substrate-binding protein n=1 Tax=Nonomuraea jiangxiensis TaxID=633440 RepID=A0A1G8HZV8_9ACTN|nr:MlaD family protein [Nonomuraea jiangxiensis]SDI12031.1 phospholipid/cholesterol/gamma-HCH transport system substrate-binding protein [Nonomuraea jiangxiensis]
MRHGWVLVRSALFVGTCVALIVLIAVQIARVGSGGGYRLVATFDDVSGLVEGDQVKIAGAPVGRVDTIRVVDGRAEVTLEVQDAVRVPADTEAAVRWRNAVGQRVIYLLPGTAPARLAPGARITRTSSVVDIGELVSDLGPLTRSLDPEQINQLLTAAARSLEGNERNLPRLLDNVNAITTTVNERKETIRRLLTDYATVTGVVARRDRQIEQLVDNLVTLSEAFADNRELIDDALVQLSTTVRTSNEVLGKNADELGALVDNLSGLTGGIRRHVNEVDQAVSTFQPLLARAHSSVNRGRYFITAIPCVALSAAPCPYGMRSPPPLRNTRVQSTEDLSRLMVGE